MNHVRDACLRATLYFHGARVEFYPQIFRSAEFARNFLYPCAAFAIDAAFLAKTNRAQRDYNRNNADEFESPFQ